MLTAMLGKGDKVAQENAQGPKLESQCAVQRCMIGEELPQHTSSPGQGWAICSSIATSTLA